MARCYCFHSKKQTVAILRKLLLISIFTFHHCRHVILHWPTKLCPNWMIADGVMTSYRLYKMAAIATEIHFRFGHVSHVSMSKAIGIPNFDQISQSMANILLLPVSENKWSPAWKSISGLILTFLLSLAYGSTSALHRNRIIHVWQSYDVIAIFKMAAVSHVGFGLG